MSFWDLSDEDKKLYNEHIGTVAEQCSNCGTWVSVDDIEVGSMPICRNCESNLTCESCGTSISAFEHTQTGFCSNCESNGFDGSDDSSDDLDDDFF